MKTQLPVEKDFGLVVDPSYKISLSLLYGIQLKMLIFNRRQHRWIFAYEYLERPDGEMRGRPDLVNEINLVVDYCDGIVIKCDLSMHIIFPGRLGKVFAYGVDISPGAKTFFQFYYERQAVPGRTGEFFFRLVEVEIGCGRRINLRPSVDPEAKALIKPVEFPFPVGDCITADFGRFQVPFLNNQGEERHFVFPASIKT